MELWTTNAQAALLYEEFAFHRNIQWGNLGMLDNNRLLKVLHFAWYFEETQYRSSLQADAIMRLLIKSFVRRRASLSLGSIWRLRAEDLISLLSVQLGVRRSSNVYHS